MNKVYDYFTKEKPNVKKATVVEKLKLTRERQEILNQKVANNAMKFLLEKKIKATVGGKKKKPVKKVGGSSNKSFTESIKQSYNIWKAGRNGHTFPYTLYKNL